MYYQRPLPSDNSPYGVNDLREIHDFNTGMYNSLETRNNFLFDFDFFREYIFLELSFRNLAKFLRMLKMVDDNISCITFYEIIEKLVVP